MVGCQPGTFPETSAGQHPPLSCRTSPPQGGDRMSRMLSPITSVAEKLPISLLAGEMAGRPEGG
ncbi:MAG: hypothetical protein EOS29_32625, partial [Mesorhizobium sp.]